ncbi:uncharacterized protein LOC106636839 [Copidosoma floridanum]|uniref:uncharacterized protein LOC106636839 n=1 Tax=Copidosoma floridanum TaxID=29053 RepID=UPI0006C9682B|nr:uncharacterized protein LOC106636839 [Copidosoma floridanum]XP_014204856.1 uncharacterized protein LOC106636839 [Copidosoma floridanum]XP_014204857.1 uncharacterized protein LOC106636839 [Copidosoma floridanum]
MDFEDHIDNITTLNPNHQVIKCRWVKKLRPKQNGRPQVREKGMRPFDSMYDAITRAEPQESPPEHNNGNKKKNKKYKKYFFKPNTGKTLWKMNGNNQCNEAIEERFKKRQSSDNDKNSFTDESIVSSQNDSFKTALEYSYETPSDYSTAESSIHCDKSFSDVDDDDFVFQLPAAIASCHLGSKTRRVKNLRRF